MDLNALLQNIAVLYDREHSCSQDQQAGRSLGGASHDEVLLHKKGDREEGQSVTWIQAEQKRVAQVDDGPEETQLGPR